MAHEAYIIYKNKGFWIKERLMEVVSQYICETFETMGLDSFNQNLLGIYYDCDMNRIGDKIGMVGVLFDKYIIHSQDKDILVSVLEQVKTYITSLGEEISIEQLNQLEELKPDFYPKSPWYTPIKTKDLSRTLDAIIELLEGTYPYDNTKEIYYEGFH